MERERFASRRHTKATPADKRLLLTLTRVFESRATYARWHAKVYSHGGGLPRNRSPKRPQVLTLTALLHAASSANALWRKGFEHC